jgi:hypothetical protein
MKNALSTSSQGSSRETVTVALRANLNSLWVWLVVLAPLLGIVL